jgi:hypothetical protein
VYWTIDANSQRTGENDKKIWFIFKEFLNIFKMLQLLKNKVQTTIQDL